MTKWEKVNLLAVAALFGLPAANLVVTITLGHTSALAVWVLVIIFAIISYRYLQPSKSHTLTIFSSWPLLVGLFIQLALAAVLFSAFLALPDVDPYHWVKVYQDNFLTSPDILTQRPLFHSLVHILDTITALNPEQVFKFAIPLLSLTMLIPAWLVARRTANRLKQFIIMLFPFLSPALIISTQMGTPQAILIIATSFFVFFLIYAHLTEQKTWHYLAGAVIGLTVLYHGLALLLFAIWLFATIWHSPKRHFALIVAVLVIAISLPYLHTFVSPALQDVRLNLTFPVSYTTIDGVPNGWPDSVGLTQYYAFYASPALLALLGLTLYQLRRATIRQQFAKLLASPSTLSLILMLLAFLTIAEILPRLLNIIILPDRAWLFVALASPVLLLTLLSAKITRHKLWPILTLTLITLNIGGAIYINNLKQHVIPDYTVTTARWINNNLPPDALVFSDQGPDYMDLYIQQDIRHFTNKAFCQGDLSELSLDSASQTPAYLFYHQLDQANPYRDRPWQKSNPQPCSPQNLIEQNPTNFIEFYRHNDQATVWQIQ